MTWCDCKTKSMPEIARILAELTDLIQIERPPHRVPHNMLSASSGLVFAKARFGRDFDCVRPTLSRGFAASLIKRGIRCSKTICAGSIGSDDSDLARHRCKPAGTS